MKKYLLSLVLSCGVAFLPVAAQDEPPADTTTETAETTDETPAPEDGKASKKAAKDAKKLEMRKRVRAKLKFKWNKTLKSALTTAKKLNTICIVLYSTPSSCETCEKFDEEIFNSKEFKKAKGIGVGFRSSSPIEEFNLGASAPAGVIVGPDGEAIKTFGYNAEMSAKEYIDMFREAQPKMGEEKQKEEEAESAAE